MTEFRRGDRGRTPAGRGPNGHDEGDARAAGAASRATAAAAVRAFLQRRGCDGRIVERGLDGLLESWEEFADALEKGYPLDTLDDYLNDVDGRQLIEDALDAVPDARPRVTSRLRIADRRVRACLVPRDRCLWGDSLARGHGWSAAREWWYFMQPSRPGPGMKRDLGV